MSSCHSVDSSRSTAATGNMPVVALAGNPNCGKTTIFNLLTGAHQHVGNWPGVTVERRSGVAALRGRKVSFVDLPGVYSLLGGGGIDQAVARDFLLDEQVDLVVNIVDASNLERHLALTAELLETGRPMVVVLNMVDEARARGLEPQLAELSSALGVPVVPMVARKGRGRKELLETIAHALDAPSYGVSHGYGPVADRALERLAALLEQGGRARKRFEALQLLEEAGEPHNAAVRNALWQCNAEIEVPPGKRRRT